jgi:hypothetical protein
VSENTPWPQAKTSFFIQAQACQQGAPSQASEDDVARIAATMDKVAQPKKSDVRLSSVARERMRMSANGLTATLLDPSATDAATVIQQMLDKGYKVIDRTQHPNVAPPPPRLL